MGDRYVAGRRFRVVGTQDGSRTERKRGCPAPVRGTATTGSTLGRGKCGGGPDAPCKSESAKREHDGHLYTKAAQVAVER